MDKCIEIEKREGETPLEAIERLRIERPELAGEKMTYAGRLDPLASGRLLVLIGDECKQKEKYLGADKEYEIEILLGFSTDTYDVLGKITEMRPQDVPSCNDFEALLKDHLPELTGTHIWTYPPYSSKTLNGKPLFEYAREGKLDEINVPERDMTFYEIEFLGCQTESRKKIITKILGKIEKVKGDFRQKEIISGWEDVEFKGDFLILKLKVQCSAGSYMRTLAKEIGNRIGIPATIFSIHRTKISLK